MNDENPFHPIDPLSPIWLAHLRRKRNKEIMEKFNEMMIATRKRNMAIIMTTPNLPVNIPKFLKKDSCPQEDKIVFTKEEFTEQMKKQTKNSVIVWDDPGTMQPDYIFKCRKRNDEPINEFYCCMYCMEEAEYMASCWDYNVKDVDGKWVGRWDSLERVE